MDHPAHQGPTKDKAFRILLGVLLVACLDLASSTPHQPINYTWVLTRTIDGASIAQISTLSQPVFHFDLCQLFGRRWRGANTGGLLCGVHLGDCSYGCGTPSREHRLQDYRYYACPATRPQHCRAEGHYHCAKWGCETIASWVNKDPHISSTPGKPGCSVLGSCNPVTIKTHQRHTQTWASGKTWGFRLYATLGGYCDPGIQCTIQRFTPARQLNPKRPNHELYLGPMLTTPSKPAGTLVTPSALTLRSRDLAPVPCRQPLLKLLSSVYNYINQTSPNITKDFWLCLNPEPPYDVGIGTNLSVGLKETDIRNSTSEKAQRQYLCKCCQKPKLTLEDLQEQGTCICSLDFVLARFPFGDSCSSVIKVDNSTDLELRSLLINPEGTWFACTTGIAPCVRTSVILQEKDLCILVVPQVYYYSGESGREHLQVSAPFLVKRAIPALVPLLVGLGIAGSAAIGTSELITSNQNLKILSQQIDLDLSDLEKSVSRLEHSVNSLAEVVLQNNRGLDLLFLKQGGLCVALGEACSFYPNHSGVIKNSLSQICNRLREREESQKANSNWYKNPCFWSPWLTTLLSAVVGPLVLLLLGH
nr:endogenous retrovirus group S71 member 1 Env polyprotein-like [Microcebus murinus]